MKKSKILLIPDLIPFPPDDGGKLCVYSFVDYLRKFHEIHLLLSCNRPEDDASINSLKECWPDVEIHDVKLYEIKVDVNILTQASNLVVRLLKKIIRTLENVQTKDQSQNDWQSNRTTPFFPHRLPFVIKLEALLSLHKFDVI